MVVPKCRQWVLAHRTYIYLKEEELNGYWRYSYICHQQLRRLALGLATDHHFGVNASDNHRQNRFYPKETANGY
jgi:hypothetical protein